MNKELTADKCQMPSSTTIGLGETVFALLGEPCKIGTPIKPMTLGLGMAAISLAAITFLNVLDTPVIQYPVFSLVAIVSLANVYAIWHSRKLRRQTHEVPDIKTRFGRLRPALVVALSAANLLIIALGLYFDFA